MFNKIRETINGLRLKMAQAIAPTVEREPLSIREVLLLMLDKFPLVDVLIDTKVEGVCLPSYLMKEEKVVLQYGKNLAFPIPDFMAGDDGVTATLSFHKSTFKTFIPWDAIKGIAPGKLPPVGPGGGSPNNLLVLKGGKFGQEAEVGVANNTPLRIAA